MKKKQKIDVFDVDVKEFKNVKVSIKTASWNVRMKEWLRYNKKRKNVEPINFILVGALWATTAT